MARKRSWEPEDEELKEDKEVGKVVFDNIDKEVTKEVMKISQLNLGRYQVLLH